MKDRGFFFIYEAVRWTKFYEFVNYYFQKVKRKYSDQELILIYETKYLQIKTLKPSSLNQKFL